MIHPITEIRESTGLSKAKFALKIGCTYDQLVRCENGYVAKIPPGILKGIRDQYGRSDEELQASYQTWRQAQAG